MTTKEFILAALEAGYLKNEAKDMALNIEKDKLDFDHMASFLIPHTAYGKSVEL